MKENYMKNYALIFLFTATFFHISIMPSELATTTSKNSSPFKKVAFTTAAATTNNNEDDDNSSNDALNDIFSSTKVNIHKSLRRLLESRESKDHEILRHENIGLRNSLNRLNYENIALRDALNRLNYEIALLMEMIEKKDNTIIDFATNQAREIVNLERKIISNKKTESEKKKEEVLSVADLNERISTLRNTIRDKNKQLKKRSVEFLALKHENERLKLILSTKNEPFENNTSV
jgi:uncharacterized small protein (DUF1192 family)